MRKKDVKLEDLKRVECPRCGGIGKVYADKNAVGAAMKLLRLNAGLSLRGVARELGRSPSYIAQMEDGRAAWSLQRVADYVSLLQSLSESNGPSED